MKNAKKSLSLFLVLVMMLSLFPASAFAAETIPAEDEASVLTEEGDALPAEEGEDEGVIAPAEDPAPEPEETGEAAPDDAAETEALPQTDDIQDYSGTCGTNLTWTLSDDGVLTISGTGSMTSYSTSNLAPWNSYKNSITSLVVESGVTTIGNYAFYGCNQILTASLPDSVTTLGSAAFRNCPARILGWVTRPSWRGSSPPRD